MANTHGLQESSTKGFHRERIAIVKLWRGYIKAFGRQEVHKLFANIMYRLVYKVMLELDPFLVIVVYHDHMCARIIFRKLYNII